MRLKKIAQVQKSSKTESWLQMSGFTLVSTIILMSFLVVILMALMSLSSSESNRVKKGRAMLEAQANARMAAIIAIGELQKYAGRDRAVTAKALITEESGDEAGSESSLMNPWLTGIWPTHSVAESDALGRDLNLRRVSKKGLYLVSGNEQFEVDESEDYPEGYFTPASEPPADAVLLTHFASDGVRLPVKVPKVQTPKGAYGYWVDDEGVKSRLNLANPHEKKSEEQDEFAAGLMGQRNRVDWIPEGCDDSGSIGLKTLPKSGEESIWAKVLTSDSLVLAGEDKEALKESLNLFGNDMTTKSRSLLTDTKNGGFQKDLTSAFQMTKDQFNGMSRTALFPNELIFPQQGTTEGDIGGTFSVRPGGAHGSLYGITPILL